MNRVSVIIAIKFRALGITFGEPCFQVIVTPGGEEVHRAQPLSTEPKFNRFGVRVWVSKSLE